MTFPCIQLHTDGGGRWHWCLLDVSGLARACSVERFANVDACLASLRALPGVHDLAIYDCGGRAGPASCAC